jgi:uncharacterized SAM-dependent methyltransferase
MTPRANTMRATQPQAPSAEAAAFGEAVLKGLSSPRKRLPCQYFYDAVGSELFEEITRLPGVAALTVSRAGRVASAAARDLRSCRDAVLHCVPFRSAG